MTREQKSAYNRKYWARWRERNAERLIQYHRDRYRRVRRSVQVASIATDQTVDDPFLRLSIAVIAQAKADGEPCSECRRLVRALLPNTSFRLVEAS